MIASVFLLAMSALANSITFPISKTFPGYGLFQTIYSDEDAIGFMRNFPDGILRRPLGDYPYKNCEFALQFSTNQEDSQFNGEITCRNNFGLVNVCVRSVTWLQGEDYTKANGAVTNIWELEAPSEVRLCPAEYKSLFAMEHIIKHMSAYFGLIIVADSRKCKLFPLLGLSLASNPLVKCSMIDALLYDDDFASFFLDVGYVYTPQRSDDIGNKIMALHIIEKTSARQVSLDLRENGDVVGGETLEKYVQEYGNISIKMLIRKMHELGAKGNVSAGADLTALLNSGGADWPYWSLGNELDVIRNPTHLIKRFGEF